MKFELLVLLSLFCFGCNSQGPDLLTRLDYYPIQHEEVSDEEYRLGTFIMKETYEAIKADDTTFTYVDHLNLSSAYALLREPKGLVIGHLEEAQAKDLKQTAQVFLYTFKKKHLQHYMTGLEFDSLEAKFTKIVNSLRKEKFDHKKYAEINCLDPELIQLLVQLKEDDQKFRSLGSEDFNKQYILDEKNIIKVDSLFDIFKTYIGTSLAGDKLSYVMWAVIQHSALEKQEFYLPIIEEAVKQNELKASSLKLLIDRIYFRKHGYQIFGSQGGAPLGTDEEISKVKREYETILQ